MKIVAQNKNILKIKKRSYMNIYKKCFYKNQIKFEIRKILFYGIRYIRFFDFSNATYTEILEAIKIIDYINNLTSKVSFYTMLNIFPIGKDFNGKKFEAKDYFSTIEYLKDKELYRMIGEYSIDDFFWNYYNTDIIIYNVNCFMIYDKFARANGQKSLMERFAEEFNIPTYVQVDENTLMNKDTLEIINIKNKGENKNE